MNRKLDLIAVIMVGWVSLCLSGCPCSSVTGTCHSDRDISGAGHDDTTNNRDRTGQRDRIGDQEDDRNLCTLLETDWSSENTASVRKFALHKATAIIEGTFGEAWLEENQKAYLFTVEKVHYGWHFLEGTEFVIPLPDTTPDAAPGTRWILALSNNHPSLWDAYDIPAWSNILTMIPESESEQYEEYIQYRANATTHVAVVNIIEQTEERTTFQVIDALKGTFPETFMDNWYHSWNLPYPPVEEDEDGLWIASLSGLTEYPDGIVLGSVIDFRPATKETLTKVKDTLVNPVNLFATDALSAQRADYHTGYRFQYSPLVVSSLVTGLAGECCTGAGGMYVSHDIIDIYRGIPEPSWFVTGGHGYYGEEDCGDAFLHGMSAQFVPENITDIDFDCLQYPGRDSWNSMEPLESATSVRLPVTGDNTAKVRTWVDAASPVYKLYNPEEDVESDSQAFSTAPWSEPLDAVTALLFATDLILFTIETVTWHEERGNYEILATTTWSLHEYEHLEVYQFKLVFTCGDPRLLQEGSRWITGIVSFFPWFALQPPEIPSQAFLIPGALLPESEIPPQLANEFTSHLQQ
jgi:hypothetical protein